MYCTGVVHFANRHACVTFRTHSCPATGNSKPDSPYQPACVRSVTSGLRSVRLCRASASWCWINGWNVRQKLNLCLLRRHDHTKVTWSPWLAFMISFFIWPWRCSHIWRHCKQWRWQHVQPLRACTRFKTPEQPSSYTKPAAGSQINATFQINFKLICWCLNLHQKVWYKSEKAFGLWFEWHYTTRGLVYGYI